MRLDVTLYVEYIWDSRDDIYAVLKEAWRTLAENAAININFTPYMRTCNIEVTDESRVDTTEDDTTTDGGEDTTNDGTGARRRMQTTYGATISAVITAYFDDANDLDTFYDDMIELAADFNVDYASDCGTVSLEYDGVGFGEVDVSSASFTEYDENGNEVSTTGDVNTDTAGAFALSLKMSAVVVCLFSLIGLLM